MKVLICGFGSVGKRHWRNMTRYFPKYPCAVLRMHSTETSTELKSSGTMEFFSFADAIIWKPTAVVIAGPTSLHLKTAMTFAKVGCDLLVEKPLALDQEDARELIEECDRRRLILMVGYTLRFYPPLREIQYAIQNGQIGRVLSMRSSVGQYLPDWRPGSDYRRSCSARRELGGGALLELSHELDYAMWMLGEPKRVRASVLASGSLNIDVEDLVEVTVEFQSGAIAQIHLDFIDRALQRECRVIGTEGTIRWSWETHRAERYNPGCQEWLLLREYQAGDRNCLYVNEIRHFIKCVQQRGVPDVDGRQGERVTKVIAAARESALTERVVVL